LGEFRVVVFCRLKSCQNNYVKDYIGGFVVHQDEGRSTPPEY